jgi:hypothetical protein
MVKLSAGSTKGGVGGGNDTSNSIGNSSGYVGKVNNGPTTLAHSPNQAWLVSSPGMLKERPHRRRHGSGLFEVGDVTDIRQPQQLGVRNRALRASRNPRRDQPIALAVDHQCRDAYPCRLSPKPAR